MAVTVTLIVLTLAALQGVRAWGTLGHATVAYIAQNYVSDQVASWAQGILDDTSDSYLASIASWADEYRSTTAGAFSAPYHYIDAEDDPPSDCNVDYSRDCTSEGCSVSAIANYTTRVAEASLSDEQVAQALKFLVHLVGDITQPLHDEAYEVGGNDVDVTYQGYSDNLHSDWDTYMPETLVGGSALSDALGWADDLIADIDSGDYADLAAGWIDGDAVDEAVDTATAWATDANAYVCTVVMPDGAEALETASDLYPAYYNKVIPTIELQIAKGGYRLANWLNLIYEGSVKKRGLEGAQGAKSGAKKSKPDVMGRDILPAPRPKSRAQMARAESGYRCNHSKRDGHHHH